jgi:hypothetical protein
MQPGVRFFAALALPFFLFFGMTSLARAQTAQGQGQTQVAVVDRLSLVKTADLDFGALMVFNGGTAVVAPSGVRTVTGGVTAAGGSPRAAAFAGYGRRNQQVRITVPSSAILIRVGGTQTMTMNTFTLGATSANGLTQIALGAAPPPRFHITSTTGLFSFTVGAKLLVATGQAPGQYAGSFPVTLVYQ